MAGFSLDHQLLQAIQVSATSADQLAELLVAARAQDATADDRCDAFLGHQLLTVSVALAMRPDGVSPEEAIGAANKIALDLVVDPGVPSLAQALPEALAAHWA